MAKDGGDTTAPRREYKPPPPLEAQLLCPHSPQAYPYTVFNYCWKDRIKKETNAAMPKGFVSEDRVATAELAASLKSREFFPIGGANELNNNSKTFSRSFGLKDWVASGGVVSTYEAQFGHPPHLRYYERREPRMRASASLPLLAAPRHPSIAEASLAHKQLLARETVEQENLRRNMSAAMRSRSQRLSRRPRHLKTEHWEDGHLIMDRPAR
mmetsp:Transcript_90680/g.143337  ORF Transcript_90680/g.143337 Transcript_90680/m.143337 type:complete len:212 (-) Transcript_90680:77-712(-)|eukprot:CAMPEP_0169066376 /NCGR_PEP_ID=MMETSP1015-20121227/2923_1 /TAXON_ID=342587 /ORGANISM="Karlodinium micrum, Strain CCMP2283" /LENGTH=211 /DNA_ID=CAMNT_0009125051 /DNA_START=70 /DNA_END=705 /DNA_ORIENTATION=+